MAQRKRPNASDKKPSALPTAKPPSPIQIAYPNAAGIDVGCAFHAVAVPPDRDSQSAREFPSFTKDLHALADWLIAS